MNVVIYTHSNDSNSMMKLVRIFLLLQVALSFLNAQQQADTLVVFFDINKSIVDVQNAEPLETIISALDVVSVGIFGYADFLGCLSHNLLLSEKRSSAVRDYLISKGLSSDVIAFSKGEGVHPDSNESNRNDLSDRGIKAHRIAVVVYTLMKEEDKVSEAFEAIEEDKEENNTVFVLEDKPLVISSITALSEENLEVDNVIVMNRIIFRPNSFEFSNSAYGGLNELLETMQKYSTLKIEIHGHTCCLKKRWLFKRDYVTEDGTRLSVGRAKAVYDFLVENGIEPNRLSYKGFGSSRKKYPLELTDYEKNMNRRVEILILKR